MIVEAPPVGIDVFLSGLDIVLDDNRRSSLHLPAQFL